MLAFWIFVLTILSLSSVAATGQTPGTVKWVYKGDGWFNSVPALGPDGTIYVVFNGRLHAINPDGSNKWVAAGGGCPPVINYDGTVYTGENTLNAFDPAGNIKWSIELGGKILGSPAIGPDSTLYVFSSNDRLTVITQNGITKWSAYSSIYHIADQPAIGKDGILYVTYQDGHVRALNPDGSVKWSFATKPWLLSSVAIASNTILVATNNSPSSSPTPDILLSINFNGVLQWDFQGGGFDATPVFDEDGTIYIGETESLSPADTICYLYAVNPDGSLKWKHPLISRSLGSSAIVGKDGTIYAGGDKLIAINPDGTREWTSSIATFSPPALADDGTLYVVSPDSCLYAIYTGSNGLAESPWPRKGGNNRNTGFVGDQVENSVSNEAINVAKKMQKVASFQNFPNPFNSTTTMYYDISKSSPVILSIYNTLGEKVITLFNGEKEYGRHSISWDGKDANGRCVVSGIYFCRLEVSGEVRVKKMVLIR